MAAFVYPVLDRPARNTLVFEMVPRDIVMKAVGLHSMVFSLNRMAGPALAGYLIGLFGVNSNFFIQGALYAVAFAMGLVIVVPPRKPSTRPASVSAELLSSISSWCVQRKLESTFVTHASLQRAALPI